MIRERFYITVNGEPWYITVFLPVTGYHVPEIMDALRGAGINEANFSAALGNLTSGRVNNGVTFSNPLLRESVSVWARSSSAAEWFNLVVHELHHLSVHIASACGMDLEGEEVCYINGGIAGYLYPLFKLMGG